MSSDNGNGNGAQPHVPGLEARLAKMARRKTLFLLAYERKSCYVTAACKASGITRCQVYAWKKEDREFAAAMQELEEQDLDFTESQLKASIRKGEGWAICFHLKCKGKKRGWVERQEVTGADGVPLGSGVSEGEERRLRELPVDDLKRIRDIIVGGGAVPAAAARPDQPAAGGEEPPRVH